MRYKKILINGWGYIYEKIEDENMNEKDINNTIAINKYGKGWDELAEYQKKGIFRVWSISNRPKLEKYLW